ncbi:of 104 kDa-like isoform X2 [Octopus vulgaris]|uniref:Of 104 kDa-like isoform X2 n=1 Tax=Octopus vulgaris TaxID=6645 RepID=A0AA36BI11_OCTVU|nr:of 104 kDa-like isoform X2 [Octopus vulgaris]
MAINKVLHVPARHCAPVRIQGPYYKNTTTLTPISHIEYNPCLDKFYGLLTRIASKIEIFVGDIPENEPLDLKNVRYVCLGYISLANNEKTDFRVRELKSVHISVVAINIIGDRLQEESTPVMDPEEIQNQDKESPLAGFNRPDYISPLDDLAFDMYQDPGVAQLIRKLEKKKQEAVLQERYEFAKRIKIGIEKLQKSGEKLGKLEVEKRQAVENEDYDKAQMKKIQIFELRLQLYEEVKIKTLLELPQYLWNFGCGSICGTLVEEVFIELWLWKFGCESSCGTLVIEVVVELWLWKYLWNFGFGSGCGTLVVEVVVELWLWKWLWNCGSCCGTLVVEVVVEL